MCIPFLAFVTIGLQPLMSLYYRRVFGVPVEQRGIIQAFDSPFTVIGLAIGAVMIDRGVIKDAGRALRVIGLCAASIAILIAGVALAPNVVIGVAFNYGTNVLGPILFTGGIVIVSLVAPPESRSSAFALFEIFALIGVIALPIVGAVADAVGGAQGIRAGLGVLPPVLLIGSAIVVSAARFVKADIARIYPDYGSAVTAIDDALRTEEPLK